MLRINRNNFIIISESRLDLLKGRIEAMRLTFRRKKVSLFYVDSTLQRPNGLNRI